jgi:hypothetical protein
MSLLRSLLDFLDEFSRFFGDEFDGTVFSAMVVAYMLLCVRNFRECKEN